MFLIKTTCNLLLTHAWDGTNPLALSREHYPLEQYRESTSLLRIHRPMSFSLFFLRRLGVDGCAAVSRRETDMELE